MSKTIYIESTDTGATLTTYWYVSAWIMWAYEQLGINDVYINWEQGHKPPRSLQAYHDEEMGRINPNQFEWWFKQPKLQNPPPRSEAEIITWQSWKDPSPVGFMAQPLSVIKNYYKKNLHFNDVVNARGHALVEKYNIDFANIIGVTWRGTDNVTDGRPRLSIGTYFPFIDDILKENPNMRIMATAEEESILDPLFAKYPNAFKIEEFYSSPLGHPHNPERFSPISGFERGMQPALMVWLFSKCAHYIKNRSSTGAVASWLSNGRIVCLGHGENLGFPANNDFAEIEGQRYPLYR
jgi:hypothetical protein